MAEKNPADHPVFDLDAEWRSLTEKTSILSAAQFTTGDACAVAGINTKQLEHAIDPKRSILNLSVHGTSRVQGKRRLFTGEDIVKLATLFAINNTGFPQRFAHVLCDTVARRANALLVGLDETPDLHFATYPMTNGDWAHVSIFRGQKDEPKLPVCVQVIAVDRLITETLAKLKAVEADQPLPDFSVPEPKPEPSPWSPENDFFMRWSKDDQGRTTLVGLTFEETAEHEKLLNADRKSPDERARYLDLENRHQEARHKRMADTYAERFIAAMKKTDP